MNGQVCARSFDGIVRHERCRQRQSRAKFHSAKQGLCTALACILSLFSGLYGSFAMALSDQIAQHAPILSTLNPAQQVTNLFYDILYYDSFLPFLTTVGMLAAMSLVCLAVATVLLRRQRYEHL